MSRNAEARVHGRQNLKPFLWQIFLFETQTNYKLNFHNRKGSDNSASFETILNQTFSLYTNNHLSKQILNLVGKKNIFNKKKILKIKSHINSSL
jgi:hypothetical protein